MQLLIDIGVNLTHKSFKPDLESILERSFDAGVEILILTGTNLRASQEAQKLAARYPGNLFSTAGIHPHNAKESNTETIPALRKLSKYPEVVAIGECGLDFDRDFSPRPVQERWFEAQLELAAELKLPLFLHERSAHVRFLEIMKAYRSHVPVGVVHCFTGNYDELKAYLDLDLHIGITGWICDERRGGSLKKLVKEIPLNRLMLETDAPFLTPRNMPKLVNRNEPAFLPYVLRSVAQSYGKSEDEIAQATTQTAGAFFGLEISE